MLSPPIMHVCNAICDPHLLTPFKLFQIRTHSEGHCIRLQQLRTHSKVQDTAWKSGQDTLQQSKGTQTHHICTNIQTHTRTRTRAHTHTHTHTHTRTLRVVVGLYVGGGGLICRHTHSGRWVHCFLYIYGLRVCVLLVAVSTPICVLVFFV